ncbi:MAG: ORF6N domain-containing protein [Bacteroidales bacterium]|nr:ORF6N domain-containing protein [Bacteroidales bacterium]
MIYNDENIINRIYLVRGKKVMIDRELAELYGVETRMLNQAVRRNTKRFPEDFMFQMTYEELEEWKSQIVISNKEKMGLRKPPLVFTEQGVAMLSSVLNSDTAIMVNIQIIRIFTKMREVLVTHKEILV